MKKYKIGGLKLKNPYFLAPMLEANDIAFRLLCKKSGCGLTYTGMINPLSRQKLILNDKPVMQIFCNSAKDIEKFIKKYDKKVCLWDFNLGCPSKLSKKNQHGVFMHKELDKIECILKEIKKFTKKPLTIKLRKSENAIAIAKMASKYCDAVAIHARTQSQGYSGKPDYEFALRLKKNISIPIIYSGDVNEKNADSILKDFDFVMFGRAAIGNPNIFAILSKTKKRFGFMDYLKLAEKYKLFFRQIKYQAMNFTKGMKEAKKMRGKLIKCKNVEEIKQIFK